MYEHLHPRWQRELLPILRKLAPDLQFVATTNSPLALVNSKPDEIRAVTLHNTEAKLLDEPLPCPEGRTVNELLLGEWFGLESILDQDSDQLLQQYRKAFSSGDRKKAEQIRPELEKTLGGFLVSPLDAITQEAQGRILDESLAATSAEKRERLIAEAAAVMKGKLKED